MPAGSQVFRFYLGHAYYMKTIHASHKSQLIGDYYQKSQSRFGKRKAKSVSAGILFVYTRPDVKRHRPENAIRFQGGYGIANAHKIRVTAANDAGLFTW